MSNVLLVPSKKSKIVSYLPDNVVAISLAQLKSGRELEKLSRKLDKEGQLIRWGISLTLTPAWGLLYDSQAARNVMNILKAYDDLVDRSKINLMRNKPKCRQTLLDADISAPKLLSNDDLCEFAGLEELPYPVVARPHHHSQGKNFVVYTQPGDFTYMHPGKEKYYQEYVFKEKEYRVHVIKNKVLIVQEKVGEDKGCYNWNHDKGFIFEVLKWGKVPRGLCPIAIEALKACKGDIGAVDIMQDKKGKYYVLEINSAPGVCEYTGNRYSKAISWMFSNPGEEFAKTGKNIIRNEEVQ